MSLSLAILEQSISPVIVKYKVVGTETNWTV